MTHLEARLAAGKLVLTAELPVINGGSVEQVAEKLEPLERYVDAVNATDNPSARAHASPLAVAIAIHQAGVEPIMQLTCRDRNRLALEADLVGAALFGIRNICCLTGDDVTAGDEPEARRVFDLDGPQLVALARSIADGHYLSGRAIEPPPPLFVGAVENPGAPPFDVRVRRAEKKADAGARFLQLQICYLPEMLERFVADALACGLAQRCALIPSICMLGSARALRFVDEHVPGVEVPDEVIGRAERAVNQSEECFEIACEQARHALSLPGVAGLHLISFRKDDAIAALCERLEIPSEPKGTPMDTVIRSASRTVTIGSDRPFCIIGERINPTGRKVFAQELRDGDLSRVEADAIAQVAAGADVLDVNAGIPLVDEPELLKSMLRRAQAAVDAPLCIDSSVVEALAAGLSVYEGRALVNSVTAEDERLEEILPLVARHDAAVIGLANDETGIPETAAKRLELARKIVTAAGDHGIAAQDVVIDPLAMTVGADTDAVNVTLEAIRMIRDELGVNMCLGASNVSFGLPERHVLNAGFLPMAMAAGLTSAIMSSVPVCVQSVRAADLLLGHDPWGASWIAAHRAREALRAQAAP